MKQDKINYVMVGGFVFAMLVLLMFVLFKLTGRDTNTEIYHVIFDNVSGIRSGTPITYGGYHIGQIESIKPSQKHERTQYQLMLAIRADWKIPKDSTASIVQPGMLSESLVDIHEGTSKTLLSPGGVISSQESAGILAFVDTFSSDIRPLLSNLSALAKDLHDQFPHITHNLNYLLIELTATAEQLNTLTNYERQTQIYSVLENANKASITVLSLLKEYSDAAGQVKQLLKSSQEIVDSNKSDIKQSVSDLRNSMDALSENMNAIIYNLDTASRNMSEFTRQIRENPGVLLGGKPPKDKAQVN